MINDYLNLFTNEQYLYTFLGVVFAGFIALFAFLGFVVVEKTKHLIEKILFNPSYINLGPSATKEYKLWMYVATFNPEILRFFEWEDMKKLINPAILTIMRVKTTKKRFIDLKISPKILINSFG